MRNGMSLLYLVHNLAIMDVGIIVGILRFFIGVQILEKFTFHVSSLQIIFGGIDLIP